MSEEGWILDVFSLEIRQNNVQQVSFCTERPLDTKLSGRASGGFRGGVTEPRPSGERVGEAPGQAYKL